MNNAVANTDPEPLVRIQNISKVFGSTYAVDNISLDIEEKAFFSLLGSSGCGKTTLLRMLAGFEAPTEGRIFIDGQDVTELPPYERQVNMMFQSYALFPHLSVAENIAFGLAGKPKGEIQDIVASRLKSVGLAGFESRYPHTLSGGQQQRVALARALAPSPAAMLLDEPFASVDVTRRRELREEARRALKAAGVVTLVVTHDPDEAMEIADRIAVMEGGQIAQCATPDELYANPASALVASLFGEAQRFPAVIDDGAAVTAYGSLPAENFSQGMAAEVIVRPEAVSLELANGANDAFRIGDIRFLGRDWLILLSSEGFPNLEPLRARVDELDGFAIGEAVSVRFDPCGTFVFAA